MKIISIEPIKSGYAGFCTQEFKKYHRFRITPASHLVIPLKVTKQINNYHQFIEIWEKIDPAARFLKTPIEVKNLTLEELKNGASHISALTM